MAISIWGCYRAKLINRNFCPNLRKTPAINDALKINFSYRAYTGPARWPIVGNTILIKKLGKQLGGQYRALLKLSDDYKTNILGLKLGSDQYVVVFGRKLVQQVFIRDEFQGRPDGFFLRLRTMGQRRGKQIFPPKCTKMIRHCD